MPFVKVGGYFIPYKSGDIEEELAQAKKAVAILGGEIENVTGFELPGGEGSVFFWQQELFVSASG